LMKKALNSLIITLHSLHHDTIDYQHVHTSRPCQEGLSLQAQTRTQARIGKNATKLADECLTHECWTLQTVEQQNCS
jgi:hypothetical protein